MIDPNASDVDFLIGKSPTIYFQLYFIGHDRAKLQELWDTSSFIDNPYFNAKIISYFYAFVNTIIT